MAKLEVAELVPQLREMDREQSLEKLSCYTKSDLLELAQVVGISVSKVGKKDVIIGQITNHFGFNRLNNDMANRPPMQR